MGGISEFLSSSGFQFGMRGIATGVQTGSGIAHAQYNAAAMRMQERSLEQQSDITAYLIRKQYESEYTQLMKEQERQQSWNRVMAAKRGITGASADVSMQSYAAKAQKNLETLYYNAAMRTGQQTLQQTSQISALNAKAAQYDWLAASTLVGGALSLGGSVLEGHTRDINKSTRQDPTAGLESGAASGGKIPEPRLIGYEPIENLYGIKLNA